MVATNINYGFQEKLWKANATTQIISASFSFLASLLIVASTGKSFFLSLTKSSRSNKHEQAANRKKIRLKKKTSPYCCFIFLISTSNILYFLAFITGPFMTQKTNPQTLSAVSDSNATCVVNGFLIAIGTTMSLFYYATLCQNIKADD